MFANGFEHLGFVRPLVEGKELGLGVVNPRIPEVESPEQITERIKAAAEITSPDKIFLNPDCGFGTFSARPMNTPEIAAKKLESMVTAAKALRQ